MSGFAADWLAMREPYDRDCRDVSLLSALAEWAADRSSLRVVDLGAGTGSAARALSAYLPERTEWTLVEHDLDLIAAGEALRRPGSRISYRHGDLSGDLASLIGGQVDLITASALIDLVSAAWLDRLAAHIRSCRCAVWIGLTYSGVLAFEPALPGDTDVIRAFNRDMVRDKGFGAALGGDAHKLLADWLEGHGRVFAGHSPWLLKADDDAPIIHALIDGIAHAAKASRSWLSQRHAMTIAMQVGHRDLLFLP